jgi:multicomponent K+:H+ antiporter subunit G
MTDIVLPDWLALAAGLLLIAGGLMTVIGACGLVRLRDFHARMHPPAMGATLGAGCILLSSMLVAASVHEILIAMFLLVTSPVSSITLMRAAIARVNPVE